MVCDHGGFQNDAEGGVKDTVPLREHRLLVTIRLVTDEALAEKRSRMLFILYSHLSGSQPVTELVETSTAVRL
jgi:hypothetical protein